ncbi:hypothetical protein TNCV_4720801 [Trichonephila clavipes]|uniref:Uncharacterized protein n=1 Tax=Trichonephila clavipes TaxID=2585209 RepID=A0A8X7BFY3_TRICX|nr:hypothetical protein TNCV_4720801 [Trichonephila clavipes]
MCDGNPRKQGHVGVDSRPIYRLGYAVPNTLRTSALKCAGALSCWNDIRAFMLAGTLCSRTGSPTCRNIRYVPPSRHLGRRYGPIKCLG